MIATLSVTILIESLVVVAYAKWQRKPYASLLITSALANVMTQSLLWEALNLFPTHYLLVLFLMEILIAGVEFLLLYVIRSNQLKWTEALSLSFCMNLASFSIGWFLRM